MESTIKDRMRFVSVAYQYFLVAVNSDQECLKQVRLVFDQQFESITSQLSHIVELQSDNKAELLKSSLEFQKKAHGFYSQFERMYLSVFEQFKQQQSVLISSDPVQAFRQWTQMFDSEYLQFLHQESICREYAELVAFAAKLGQQSKTMDRTNKCESI